MGTVLSICWYVGGGGGGMLGLYYSLTSLRVQRLFPVLLPYVGHRLHIVEIDNVWYPH